MLTLVIRTSVCDPTLGQYCKHLGVGSILDLYMHEHKYIQKLFSHSLLSLFLMPPDSLVCMVYLCVCVWMGVCIQVHYVLY